MAKGQSRRGDKDDPMLDVLRQHRKAQGLSLREAAKRMKVQVSTVHSWEQGINKPQPRMIPKIAGLYRIDPMEIVQWIEPPLPGAAVR